MNFDAEQVKQHADLARVVGGYVALKRGGNADELVGKCPFHKDSNPSFTITKSKQLYHCFGCEASGDVFEFIRRIERLSSFTEAVQRIADLVGSHTITRPPTSAQRGPKRELRAICEKAAGADKSPLGKVTATYPYPDESGELLYEVQRIEPGRLGKAKDFRQRRPHPVDGAWVWGISAGAYRKGANGEWSPVKGNAEPDDDELPEVRRVLFRLPEVLKAEVVYLVEGEKDVLTLEKAGLVATTNSGGAAQKWLPEYSEALRGRRVIVLPDNDEPGKKRGAAIAKELTGIAAEVNLVEIPAGKDITEYIDGGHTRADLEALIHETRRRTLVEQLESRGLLSPVEIVQAFEGGINVFLDPSKRAPGIETKFRRYDDMTLGLHSGELTIIAARPAMGKSSLALCIADNVARQGHPVAFFSLEMSRESLLTRLICSRARIDQLRFRSGDLTAEERSKVRRHFNDLCELPLRIDDNTDSILPTIHSKLTRMRAERGLALVVIDYLQLMRSKGKSENRTQQVGELSRGLKLMSREFKAPFLVLSQLSRAPEMRHGNQRPQLSDLRDSGEIEQNADNVAFIFREEVYRRDRADLRGLAEVIIAKQRNGPIGTVDLVFLHHLTRFEDRAREEAA